MEVMGVMAFIFVLWNMNLPDKVKKNNKKIERIEKQINKEKSGDVDMSEMIKKLVGQKCEIQFIDNMILNQDVEILEVDEEWVKILKVNKKNSITYIKRIEDIKEIKIIENNIN